MCSWRVQILFSLNDGNNLGRLRLCFFKTCRFPTQESLIHTETRRRSTTMRTCFLIGLAAFLIAVLDPFLSLRNRKGGLSMETSTATELGIASMLTP